jgi:hypothetical protein
MLGARRSPSGRPAEATGGPPVSGHLATCARRSSCCVPVARRASWLRASASRSRRCRAAARRRRCPGARTTSPRCRRTGRRTPCRPPAHNPRIGGRAGGGARPAQSRSTRRRCEAPGAASRAVRAPPSPLWVRAAVAHLWQAGFVAAFQLALELDPRHPLWNLRRIIVPECGGRRLVAARARDRAPSLIGAIQSRRSRATGSGARPTIDRFSRNSAAKTVRRLRTGLRRPILRAARSASRPAERRLRGRLCRARHPSARAMRPLPVDE